MSQRPWVVAHKAVDLDWHLHAIQQHIQDKAGSDQCQGHGCGGPPLLPAGAAHCCSPSEDLFNSRFSVVLNGQVDTVSFRQAARQSGLRASSSTDRDPVPVRVSRTEL
jgi:hypothetical protein